MAKIYVDINNSKNETNSALPKAKGNISDIKSDVKGVKRNLYYKIQDKDNISSRLNNSVSELTNIQEKIQTLYYELNEYLDSYDYTEERIVSSVFGDKGKSKSSNADMFDSVDGNQDKNKKTLLDLIKNILGITIFNNNDMFSSVYELLFKTISGLNSNNDNNTNKADTTKITKKVFDIIGNFFDGVGELSDDADLSFASPLIEYFSELYGFTTSQYNSSGDAAAGWLSLFDKSGKVETGLYNYFLENLDPYQASKLYDKFGNKMTGLSVIGSMAGFIGNGIESYEIFTDPNAKWYDKTGQLIDFWGSGAKAIGNTYIATDCSSKVLQFVSKPGNQILATESPKLTFSASSAAKKKLAKASTYVALADVGFSFVSGGVKKYGECMEDGEFSWKDAGSVGMASSCDGLAAVGRGLTFGLVDIDGQAMAQNLENKANDFIRGDSWAANYIRNEDNNDILRFGVSVGSGAYLLGKEAYEGLKSGAQTVGGWISSGWDAMKNIF